MIGYICLTYIGVRIDAPVWYYILIALAAFIKTVSATVKLCQQE